MYVAVGPLFGMEGAAVHDHGDWWTFAYVTDAAPFGVRMREVEVFRTAIELRAVEHAEVQSGR